MRGVFDVVLVWFLAPLVRDFGDKIREWWEEFLKKWAGIFGWVIEQFKKIVVKFIWDFIKGLFKAVVEEIVDLISSVFNSIVEAFRDVASAVETVFKSLAVPGNALLLGIIVVVVIASVALWFKPKR